MTTGKRKKSTFVNDVASQYLSDEQADPDFQKILQKKKSMQKPKRA